MNDDEMNQRRSGFMTAIGLLLENADPTAREGILTTLNSYGEDLHKEVEVETYSKAAADEGVGPCAPGFRWDPELQMCVPIIIG
jgi:hypothetical protein